VNIEFLKGWAPGLVCLLISAGQAMAQDQIMTAEFVPSLANPSNNVFTNTTPPGILCATMPNICDGQKSFLVPGRMTTSAPITANDPNPRQGLSIKVPADWRDITVRHATTGETTQVQLRFTGFGGRYAPNPTASDITGIADPQAAFNALWNGGDLGVVPAPCIGRFRDSTARYMRFLWHMPVSTSCAKQSAYDYDSADINDIELLYELRTPTPLNMSAGIWESTTTYLWGPGKDFDFGDNFLPFFPDLNIHISLSVSHHLRVVFPPGANRLALEPEGGWMPWISRGRRPERIVRDQPFQFTTSGPVKMRVECQHLVSGHCAIANPKGDRVPVETRISLPAGMHDLTGGPISKKLLSTVDDLTAVTDQYVADQTGHLHFEVSRTHVDAMLAYPDTTYSGNVTVVWDSYLIQ
jgi:hypothetical protein